MKVYTSDTCRACGALKAWLDKVGIEYEERNVDRDPVALAELERMGVLSLPVAVVGKQMFVGFSPNIARCIMAAVKAGPQYIIAAMEGEK